MGGIFRRPFRLPPPVQGEFGTLSAGAPTGQVRPAAFVSASAFFAPVLRATLKPAAVATGATLHVSSVAVAGAAKQPAHHANGQSFFAPVLRGTVKPAALGSGAALFAPRAVRALAVPALASGAILHGPRLVLRVWAASYANAPVLRAVVVALAGVKLAPFVPSAAQVFVPQVSTASASGFVGGAIGVGAGWGDAPPRRRRAPVPTWPNLPKSSTAPPWRLTVVTPDVARAQARVRLAWRKRIEQEQRKRAADRRVAAIFDALVDQEVARTIATLNAEV